MCQREDKYLEFVQSQADKQGKFFMLDSGEGNDYFDSKSNYYVEDLSGWLLDENLKKEFEVARKNGSEHREFKKYYIFAKWYIKDDGQLMVKFVKYDTYDDR